MQIIGCTCMVESSMLLQASKEWGVHVLTQGSVEWVAPAEYMVRAPMPPTFFFVIDVSQPAVASGSLAAAVQGIQQALDNLPGAERTQIGFLTFDRYSRCKTHWVDLHATLMHLLVTQNKSCLNVS